MPDEPLREILLVDGDDAARGAHARVLVRAGYRVREAANAGEALALLAGPAADCGLMLTDLWLGPMSGAELADIARRLRPGLTVVYATSDPSLFAAHSRRATGIIAKPCSEEELLAVVALAFGDGPSPAR